MLDRLDTVLWLEFKLAIVRIGTRYLCFWVDRSLYWLSQRVPSRWRRPLIIREFDFFTYVWAPGQDVERDLVRRIRFEVQSTEIE